MVEDNKMNESINTIDAADAESKELEKQNKCKHKFIVDYVDITPERSQRIVYCKKCFKCK